jgi:ketosteroid isomerase-like protein
VTVDNAETVMRKMVEMFETGDVSPIADLVSDDYHDHQGLRGVAVRGTDGFRRVVDAARAATVGLSVTIADLIADGDRAAARLRWRGVSPTGEPVDRETIDIVRTRDGRAVEHWGAGT